MRTTPISNKSFRMLAKMSEENKLLQEENKLLQAKIRTYYEPALKAGKKAYMSLETGMVGVVDREKEITGLRDIVDRVKITLRNIHDRLWGYNVYDDLVKEIDALVKEIDAFDGSKGG